MTWVNTGTGKTAIALMHIHYQIQKNPDFKAVIICPANLVGNWEENIETLINFEGIEEKHIAELKNAITISSFQKMYQSKFIGTWKNKKTGKTYKRYKRSLRPEVDKQWDVMFVDESHCIGLHDSKQSEWAWKLAKQAKTRYIMTGTPVHGGGGQADYQKLYGQMRVLLPDSWMSWEEFTKEYVASFHPYFTSKIETYHIDKCRKLMEEYSIVCRLEDCVDLPGHTDIEVTCKLAEPKMYNDIVDMDVAKYGLDLVTGGSTYTKLRQLCSGSVKVDDETTLVRKCNKDDKVLDILNGTDGKVVIFCMYIASIKRVAQLCEKAERSYIIYNGATKDKNSWKEFQYGDKEVIIAQYMSGGTGLNLYASHHTIFYEPVDSAVTFSQAKKRTERTGQTMKCINYFMVTPGTVEEKAWKNVRAGKDVSEAEMQEWIKVKV